MTAVIPNGYFHYSTLKRNVLQVYDGHSFGGSGDVMNMFTAGDMPISVIGRLCFVFILLLCLASLVLM